MRVPEHGGELLVEFAQRRRLRAKTAFLENDVALRVELSEDRVEQTVRLHPRPQLELVLGQAHEVHGPVLVGRRVQEFAPVFRVDLVHLILDDVLALLQNQRIELRLELLVPRGLGRRVVHARDLAATEPVAHLRHLVAHVVSHLLLLVDELQVEGDVLGADDVGALEHHVLKEVRDAGDARPFVRRADASHPAGGDGRRIVPLVEQPLHSVRQSPLFDFDPRLLRGGDEGGEG